MRKDQFVTKTIVQYDAEFPKPPDFVYLSANYIEKELPVILPDRYKSVPISDPPNQDSELTEKKSPDPNAEPIEKKLLYFVVEDNIGEGNCFYLSICDSSAFRTRYPNWEGGYMALRKELKKHAERKPELTRGILDVHFGPDEKFKWAGRFLTETFTNPKFLIGKPYRKGLYQIRTFWKELNFNNRKKPSNHEIEAAILQRMQEDDPSDNDDENQDGHENNCKFVNHVLNTFFSDDDIEEMAWKWWPIGIGTDNFWGGLGEQILFTDRFGLQVVVLQLKDENVWNFSSHVIVSSLPNISCALICSRLTKPKTFRKMPLVSK
jgi:hypothetical protein